MSPPTPTPLVLAIDIGTSGARAILYDRTGKIVPGVSFREKFVVRVTPEGAAEADPEEILSRMERCVDRALAEAGERSREIRAVALCCLASSLVALDEEGAPLSPLYLYSDTRDAADAARLRRIFDEDEVQERTGCMLRSSYWPARISWLERTHPRVFGALSHISSLGGFLWRRLFGAGKETFSLASWSGLLDRRLLCWDGPLCEALGLPSEKLFSLTDIDEAAQGLSPAYAARWPLLAALPWFPALGDGAAANLGSGCTDPTRAAVTIGTSAALRIITDRVPPVPPGLFCYRVDRRLSLLGGATNEGGSLVSWMRRTFQLGELATLEEALFRAPPDGHGLTVLPFLLGERCPGFAGGARATLHGLAASTTPLDIFQAGLEAVAYRLALIAERLSLPEDVTLVASGGALLRSPYWMQLIADVIGRPVIASAEPEASSRGAALCALRALGALSSLEEAGAALGTTYAPREERHRRYQEARARQERLYEKLLGGEGL